MMYLDKRIPKGYSCVKNGDYLEFFDCVTHEKLLVIDVNEIEEFSEFLKSIIKPKQKEDDNVQLSLFDRG